MNNRILSTVAAATLLMMEAATAPANAGPKDGFIPLPPPIFGGIPFDNMNYTTRVKASTSELIVSLDYSDKPFTRAYDPSKTTWRMEPVNSKFTDIYSVSALKSESHSPRPFPAIAITDFWQRAPGKQRTNSTADLWTNKFGSFPFDMAAIPFPPDGVVPR